MHSVGQVVDFQWGGRQTVSLDLWPFGCGNGNYE